MRPIVEVAGDMGLAPDTLELHGRYMAKVPLDAFPARPASGKLVLVTAMTPTPLGEGKTVTAIGLTQALARLGKRPVLTLRQPSVGPVFGMKGGGTGGGHSQVVPAADINLHFTGDSHAVASAHNLLAAMTEAAVYHRTIPDVEVGGLEWRRVTNMEDRGLRNIVSGLGMNGHNLVRETGFDIDAASEIMAVLALATTYEDLRTRLGRLLVGYSKKRAPVTALDLNAVGAMMALLKDAIKPNLVQTLEGQPALVHTGPFGNIAHGCSSIVADQLALRCGDMVVTEAGFGAELGLEKFMHIKVRAGGTLPNVVVVVVTARALKWHGGASMKELDAVNMDALRRGLANMEHAVNLARMFGLLAVVAVNRFPNDEQEELSMIHRAASDAGAVGVADSFAYSQGGPGTLELAKAVMAARQQISKPRYLYSPEATIQEKVELIGRQVYEAGEIRWEQNALHQAQQFTAQGWGALPVCIAKTHLSLSADPTMRGRPQGHVLPVTGLRVALGAGFVYPIAGDIQTLPGLPREPNALRIDIDSKGEVKDLL